MTYLQIMAYFIYQIIKIPLLLALPFVILIRGSVFLHTNYEWFPWPALMGGAFAAVLILIIYLSLLHGKITGKMNSKGALKRRSMIALILVLGYCFHGALFLSSRNAKGADVQSEYTNLHPILRLGVSTLVWMDKDLIMTDGSRNPEDYKKMGLKTIKRSLHYQQKNGYSHAFDIRTNGRSELRNNILNFYFKLMGFNTLRHIGTADHLHISLHSHDHPSAI